MTNPNINTEQYFFILNFSRNVNYCLTDQIRGLPTKGNRYLLNHMLTEVLNKTLLGSILQNITAQK